MGGHARRHQPADDAGVGLEEVAAVDRGVVAGAARREQHPPAVGREVAEPVPQRQQRVEGRLRGHRLLGHLPRHLGGQHRLLKCLTSVGRTTHDPLVRTRTYQSGRAVVERFFVVRIVADGPRPKHAQLRDALAELATSELAPDTAIPSERELMTTYDVSRATVRKAIDALVVDGLLQRIHGRGTFVARPRLESRLHLASFSQDMRRRGLTPSTRLLERRARPSAGRGRRGARARRRRPGLEAGPGPARRRPADRAGERVVPQVAAARPRQARPRRLAVRALLRRLRPDHRQRRADAVGRGRGRHDRDPPRRSAAHPAAGLPPGLEGRREATRVRRVPLPRRPLPDPHVTGP